MRIRGVRSLHLANSRKDRESVREDRWVLYLLGDWERRGELVNAMASSLSHVERGGLVYSSGQLV